MITPPRGDVKSVRQDVNAVHRRAPAVVSRVLPAAGIDKVYFAVVGRGFRQDDLTRLTAFMTGTPIRSVCFMEARALMRLVDQSIQKRREFRLADIDTLLFGNKIIAE
ncbi:MAG: hypothetical protein B7Z73_08060 [Planctomycetia bacterium 21-64-5]|nr:MAG: hypothetical protein B7Z73_08060 [Planctomycetia bacterium 21-64-5]